MTDNNSKNSDNTGFGGRNPDSESSVDVACGPVPDRTPDTDAGRQPIPPARSGNAAENTERPTEGGTVHDPIHHTGHIPPPVTANRD